MHAVRTAATSRPRPSWAALVVWVLSAVFALAGCSAETTARRCATAADCTAGQRCQTGTCFDACVDLDDCSTTEYCGGGLCLDRPACLDRADCPEGFACEQRLCLPQTPECRLDSDCPPRFSCELGGCIPPGVVPDGECLRAADCATGESCVDNRCVPRDEPDAGALDDTVETADVRPPADASADGDEPPPRDTSVVDIPDTDPPTDVAPEDTDPPDAIRDTSDAARDAGEDDLDTDTSDEDVDVVEPECRTLVDCPAGNECIDGACVEVDLCEGRQPGEFTDSCRGASGCCNGLCLGNVAAGQGYCTQLCDSWSECNPLGIVTQDYFCLDVVEARVCARSDFGRACASASVCVDQKCLQAPTRMSGQATSCTHGCRTGADCGPGLACGAVPFLVGGAVRNLNVCLPVGEVCAGNDTDCFSRVCLDDARFPAQYCSAYCDRSDATACPQGWACVQVGPDAVCARTDGL